MLKTLSVSGHIKICASSLPHRTYERLLFSEGLQVKGRMLDIADFTRADMEISVRDRLHSSERFRELAYPNSDAQHMDPVCKSIMEDISSAAKDVWLWVCLVTRQLIRQIERNESLAKLREIVDNLPKDLERLFERVIEKVDDLHKAEMAQTFLVAVDELQPLSLYASHLLERERQDPSYATQEPIMVIDEGLIKKQYGIWTSRLQNRCGDLLVVDKERYPVFLSHLFDFLHRTVRDFLRDCYQSQLRTHLKNDFDSLVSLCKINLCFLKGLTIDAFRARVIVNRVIGLTDELLYYAHEMETRHPDVDDTPLVPVLDQLDRVNSHFARDISNHRTHARDSPSNQGYDRYVEGGRYNFLALTVQARLVKYVRAKLHAGPSCMQKRGRCSIALFGLSDPRQSRCPTTRPDTIPLLMYVWSSCW